MTKTKKRKKEEREKKRQKATYKKINDINKYIREDKDKRQKTKE